jgi:hypothetical protein
MADRKGEFDLTSLPKGWFDETSLPDGWFDADQTKSDGIEVRVHWAKLQVPEAAPVTSKVKYWNGSAWVAKTTKRWNGSAWVTAVIKKWNGSAWVTI